MEDEVLHTIKVVDEKGFELKVDLIKWDHNMSVNMTTHVLGHHADILLTDSQVDELVWALEESKKFKEQLKNR